MIFIMLTALVRRKITYLLLNSSSSGIRKSNGFLASFYSTCLEKQHVVYDFLVNKHHFSPESASRLAPVLPHLRNPEKSDSVLSFFKNNGFSNAQLEKIMKQRPTLVSVNLDKYIKPKFKIFQDLGLSADEIANMMARNTAIVYRNVNNGLIPSLSALKDLLGSNEEVAKLVRKSGWLLTVGLEESVLPNIEFLKSYPVSMEQIIRSLSFPRFLLHKPENMRKYAEKVEEMGVKRSSKMFIHGVRVVGSMKNETWELKLQAFRDLGFSEYDILRAFRRAPPVFSVSEKKMKLVKEIIVSSGKYDMSCIINSPTSLICSPEKRYKPRLQVLRILESKNLITDWPKFTMFSNRPDKMFCVKFVKPYLDEIGDTFLAKSYAKSASRLASVLPPVRNPEKSNSVSGKKLCQVTREGEL